MSTHTRLPDDAWASEQVQAGMSVLLNERNLTAYAEATLAEAGGLVRRLQALQEHLRHQPLTHADAVAEPEGQQELEALGL